MAPVVARSSRVSHPIEYDDLVDDQEDMDILWFLIILLVLVLVIRAVIGRP